MKELAEFVLGFSLTILGVLSFFAIMAMINPV